MKLGTSFCFLFVAVIVCAVGNVMATEEAKYTVIEQDGDYELRQYEPHIVAGTLLEGDFETVGKEGFRRLYDYISGNNRKRQSIAMTAPVSQEASNEKIPMTAPVNQERIGAKWSITFLMPAQYTMETLPAPLDTRVMLKEEPARLMAAIKYSGTWSKKRYEKRKTELLRLIEKRSLRPGGEPIFARYNPPFMPWFLRRNEVLIPVERGQDIQAEQKQRKEEDYER